MNRIVVLFDCKYMQFVHAYLATNRVQYSSFTDIFSCETRVSVPHAKGVSLLAELRRNSISYELL